MLTSSDFRFFLVLARSESLAAAARELDVTPSAVTQRLQELEHRVGVRLVVRSGRRLLLTDEGELLADRGRDITDEIAELSETLVARRGEVAGHLRVIAPLGFGRRYVAPVAAAFLAEHPAVTLDLTLSDRLGWFADTSWDVAVHIGEIRPAGLAAQTLAPNRRLLCASPAFVERYGSPASPTALREFRCIALRENDEDVTMWRFTNAAGETSHVRIDPELASNDGDVVREWAIGGHGVVVRSEWSVADDVREGRLVPLLEDYALPSADVLALMGPRKGRSARTSKLVAVLRDALTPTPWRA